MNVLHVRVVFCVRVALRVRVALYVQVVLCVRVALRVGFALHVRVILCVRVVALRAGAALHVECHWNTNVEGHNMFKVFSKLKILKKPLRKLLHDQDKWNVSGPHLQEVAANSASNMVREVTIEEIKAAMFAIGDDKSPGPDGYTSAFFKKGWSIVGPDVCNAVRDFFSNGCLLKEINHTFLPLFRRWISDNILITQELMHRYHRNRGPLRCAFKIDIQKRMTWWIGAFWRIFLPDLAFIKAGSYFRLFRYHKHCEDLELINVCFADDLFIFACGDLDLDRVIMEALDEFKMVSGVVLSIPKSMTYFCNVVHHVKLAILIIMPFSEGELPVKYLRVPLISSRLLNRDCKMLVEKAKNQIAHIDITREGYHINTCVADLVSNGSWYWSQSWLLKAPNLGLILIPVLDEFRADLWQWRDLHVSILDFLFQKHGKR
uniref:Reverse transcriptase domain-containing protein n=1 Tax=Tanacetum cinerariifolium TaxID=118510 RepID=A0A6L2MP85_TANCI|nr:hypothetical protein [Tanacetum cinerariifolium]